MLKSTLSLERIGIGQVGTAAVAGDRAGYLDWEPAL